LFGFGEGDKMSLDPLIWIAEEKLSQEDNQILDEPFYEQEVIWLKIRLQALMEFV
jgi:hypothetical protein